MRASTSRKRQTGRKKKREEDHFLHPLCSSKWIIQSHTLVLHWEVQTLPCKWHSCGILGNETLKGSADVQSRLSQKCPPEERSEGRRRRHDDWGSLIKVVLRVEKRWFSDWMTDWDEEEWLKKHLALKHTPTIELELHNCIPVLTAHNT